MTTGKDVDAALVGAGSTVEMAEALRASGAVDDLLAQIDTGDVALTGEGGLLPGLIKLALERGLAAELTDHLGYEKGDPIGRVLPNARNGSSPKTVLTEAGPVPLEVPRDRDGSFTPTLVPKGQRRIGGLDDMIISLYAGGMTLRDIQFHLASTIGAEVSHETISKIVDEISDEVLAWQRRPLEPLYPVIYLDAMIVKVKDGGHTRNKAAHIAVGVDMAGVKHVLGIWVQPNEGASFWASVCADLANRGIKDVLIVCCDGLTGFPEAIAATWSQAAVQTCVVHLIRNSMRFVSYGERKAVAAALKPIYTAPHAEAARVELDAFTASELGKKNPTVAMAFERAWEQFIPFLAFPPELRRVIYTTNSIESLNYQMRKVIKNRGQFPNDAAAVKLLWLAICNIEDKRAAERAKERDQKLCRTAPGRLVEGQVVTNWMKALEQLALVYPERIERYL
ncbi:transposase [Mycobacteroides abscessus subsp. abscessus]|nr:transposase [Mycobacteroides abscessus subsp. abscessus]